MICLMRYPVNKQTVRAILLAVLLILFLTALPACRSEERRAESIDPLTNQTAYLASAQERAWSGNLHFGNFVVAAHDGLIANTYRQQVALFDFDNTQRNRFILNRAVSSLQLVTGSISNPVS